MKQNYNLKEQFRGIELRRKNYFNDLIEKTDLNLMQLEILAALYENPEQNTFTEIMKAKDYAKSFVSTAINDLVKRSYIKKLANPSNKKVFILILDDSCQDIIEEYYICINLFQNDAFKGVSSDKFQIFKEVLDEISENLRDKWD